MLNIDMEQMRKDIEEINRINTKPEEIKTEDK